MIDHVSIAVRDLKKAEPFYVALLAPLRLVKLREWPDAAIGFGKKYPDFWINCRAAMDPVNPAAAAPNSDLRLMSFAMLHLLCCLFQKNQDLSKRPGFELTIQNLECRSGSLFHTKGSPAGFVPSRQHDLASPQIECAGSCFWFTSRPVPALCPEFVGPP